MGLSREREYILNRGASVVADHYRNKIIDNFSQGQVAVMVKDFGETLYFLPCNEYGYPKYHTFKTVNLSLVPLTVTLETGEDEFDFSNTKEITSYSIIPYRPMVLCKVPDIENFAGDKTIVFLWEGRIVDSKLVKIEDLDVKNLMKLAQEAIKKREGLIIDLVQSNRLVK